MSEPQAPPRLIKFVRRALRANPKPTFDEVLEGWRARAGGDVSAEHVQSVYDEELARAAQPTPRDPNQGRTIRIVVGVWLLAHVVIALGLGLPSYMTCRSPTPGDYATLCGLGLGLSFLFVGIGQVVYGAIAAFVAHRLHRASITQGLLIAFSTVAVLFTVVCFGATITG